MMTNGDPLSLSLLWQVLPAGTPRSEPLHPALQEEEGDIGRGGGGGGGTGAWSTGGGVGRGLWDGEDQVLGDQCAGGEGVFTGARQGIQVLPRDPTHPLCHRVRRSGHHGPQVSPSSPFPSPSLPPSPLPPPGLMGCIPDLHSTPEMRAPH